MGSQTSHQIGMASRDEEDGGRREGQPGKPIVNNCPRPTEGLDSRCPIPHAILGRKKNNGKGVMKYQKSTTPQDLGSAQGTTRRAQRNLMSAAARMGGRSVSHSTANFA